MPNKMEAASQTSVSAMIFLLVCISPSERGLLEDSDKVPSEDILLMMPFLDSLKEYEGVNGPLIRDRLNGVTEYSSIDENGEV